MEAHVQPNPRDPSKNSVLCPRLATTWIWNSSVFAEIKSKSETLKSSNWHMTVPHLDSHVRPVPHAHKIMQADR